jgi:hypothetical protein
MDFEHEPIEPRLFGEQVEKALSDAGAGSARDFLNIFVDLAMRLEQLPQMPEVADEVLGWKSVSFNEFCGRIETKRVYGALSMHSRERFDDCIAELDTIALASVASVRRQFRNGPPQDFERVTPVCHRAADKMRNALSRASRLVKAHNRR